MDKKNKKYVIPNYILASKNIRFFNFIVDLLFIKIIFSILIFLFDILFSSEISDKIDDLDKIETYLLWSILSFFYYTITEFLFSNSIAKYFSKTCVVLKNGQKPHLSNILARSALRQMPFEYLTFLQGRKLGFHDENSSTFVVIKSKLDKSIIEF